jgi:ferredoxin
MRKVGPKSKRIYVDCVNREKGAIARKNCEVACIGCGKCVKICPHDAIVMENNLAYISFEKCKLCRKCVEECPTNAIVELNFPLRKTKADAEKTETVPS